MNSRLENISAGDGPDSFAVFNTVVASLVKSYEHGAKMEEAAMLDSMTGLKNRRALEIDYAGLQRSAGLFSEDGPENTDRRTNRPQNLQQQSHSVIILDIDDFKQINDGEGGHQAGDEVIIEVADTMRMRARANDVLVRQGGDEFVMLLPWTKESDARRVAEDLRILVNDNTGRNLSIGVAPVDLTLQLEENIHRADEALYAAKELGKDMVVSWHELPEQRFSRQA